MAQVFLGQDYNANSVFLVTPASAGVTGTAAVTDILTK